MKAPILTLIVPITLCSASIAQKADFIGEFLVIRDGTRRIRLSNVIEPDSLYRVVHAIQKRATDYLVVIGVSELSRGYPAKNGPCGAGI